MCVCVCFRVEVWVCYVCVCGCSQHSCGAQMTTQVSVSLRKFLVFHHVVCQSRWPMSSASISASCFLQPLWFRHALITMSKLKGVLKTSSGPQTCTPSIFFTETFIRAVKLCMFMCVCVFLSVCFNLFSVIKSSNYHRGYDKQHFKKSLNDSTQGPVFKTLLL